MELPIKEELMEKYWMGETTPAEEASLRVMAAEHSELFSREELKYLNGIQQVQELSLGADFGKNLIEELATAETEERPISKVVPIWRKSWWSMAASIVLIVGLFFSIQKFNQAKMLSDLSEEEIAAYEETKDALLLISQKMNKIKVVQVAFAKFDETHSKIKPSRN